MRIMFDKDVVKEFVSIDVTPCWGPKKDVFKDVPDMYSVSMGNIMRDKIDFDYVGKYKLDGKRETYDAAVKNFEYICEQLLTKGWVKAEQFENFEWY